MTRALLLALFASAVLPVAAIGAPPGRDAAPPGERTAAGEAIVAFEPGVRPAGRSAARDAADVRFGRALGVARAQLVSFDGPVPAAVRRLEREPGVAYAQPNFRYEAHSTDTFSGDLWGLGATPGVGAEAAWPITHGAGQVIAVVDTGVDMTHPDVAPNLWTNPGEFPGNGLDDDGNGHADDVRGFDFVSDDGDPDDFEFHGTHVAGTAAAAADNSLGVAGVAPGARLMAVRVLNANGAGFSAAIAEGIAYAAREGAGVINLSLGGPSGAADPVLAAAIEEARTRNAVIVASAGNEGSDNDAEPTVPCTLPAVNLICVAALDEAGDLAGFSNVGATSVDVGAPGVAILSAKTDYARVFEEDFSAGLAGWEQLDGFPGAVDWGVAGGVATDSPGGDYGEDTYSQIHTAANVDLSSERACRLHFAADYILAPGDEFRAGVFDVGQISVMERKAFTGDSGGVEEIEIGLNTFDGNPRTRPFFAILSNPDAEVADGAAVDDVRLLCRDATYSDTTTTPASYDETGSGNYVEFDGTSMAAPHVSGVAALVRAADPGVSAAQVVAAIRAGAKQLPSLAGVTVSGGAVDAAGAIAVALGVANPPPAGPPPPEQPADSSPALDLRGAPGRLRLSRTRRFTYRFDATPAVGARVTIRTRRKVRVRRGGHVRRVHIVIARRRFVVPPSGRARVRVRLSRRTAEILLRNGRFRLRVAASVTDADGDSTRAARNLTLLPRRPAR